MRPREDCKSQSSQWIAFESDVSKDRCVVGSKKVALTQLRFIAPLGSERVLGMNAAFSTYAVWSCPCGLNVISGRATSCEQSSESSIALWINRNFVQRQWDWGVQTRRPIFVSSSLRFLLTRYKYTRKCSRYFVKVEAKIRHGIFFICEQLHFSRVAWWRVLRICKHLFAIFFVLHTRNVNEPWLDRNYRSSEKQYGQC